LRTPYLKALMVCLLLGAGCAYQWGSGITGSEGKKPLLVQVPAVTNLTGVPGLEERFVEAFIATAREYPEVRVIAGNSGISVTVVVKSADTDILVKDNLDRVVEARRRLIAEVTSGNGGPVTVDADELTAGQGLDLRRRPGSTAHAESETISALARAVLDVIVRGGSN